MLPVPFTNICIHTGMSPFAGKVRKIQVLCSCRGYDILGSFKFSCQICRAYGRFFSEVGGGLFNIDYVKIKFKRLSFICPIVLMKCTPRRILNGIYAHYKIISNGH